MKKITDLKNVGKAALQDLTLLDIHSVEELARQDPSLLFAELERRTQARQNPCVWDVFAAIIPEAAIGQPTTWSEWSAKREIL